MIWLAYFVLCCEYNVCCCDVAAQANVYNDSLHEWNRNLLLLYNESISRLECVKAGKPREEIATNGRRTHCCRRWAWSVACSTTLNSMRPWSTPRAPPRSGSVHGPSRTRIAAQSLRHIELLQEEQAKTERLELEIESLQGQAEAQEARLVAQEAQLGLQEDERASLL